MVLIGNVKIAIILVLLAIVMEKRIALDVILAVLRWKHLQMYMNACVQMELMKIW